MITSILKGFLGAIIGLVVSLGFLFLAGDSIFNALVGPERGATNHGAAAYFVMLVFAWAGLIIGAILIYLPWQINRWIVLLLLILFGVNLYLNRYLYIERPPRVEQVGNFEVLTYQHTTVPLYGLRYDGKPIAIEEEAGFLSDELETYTRFDTLITLTVPATITPPVFVITVGDQYHDFFYLVREVAGQAKVERLSNNTTVTAQWLDVAFADPAVPRNLLFDPASSVVGRWLLLGDNCVLDVQTLKAYSIDTESLQKNAQMRWSGPALAFSPDEQSFVRLVEGYQGKTDATLAVFHFIENTFYFLLVDRAQMRYPRLSEIDSQWLAYYFTWQKDENGVEQLAPRTGVTPLPYRTYLDTKRFAYEVERYYLGPVKPAMLETLATFLEDEFAAVKVESEQSFSSTRSITLKIGEQNIYLDYIEDASPTGEIWFRLDKDNTSDLLSQVAQRFDAVLKTGVHDELFLGGGEKP